MNIGQVYDALLEVIEQTEVENDGPLYTLKDKALVIPSSSLKGEREAWGAQFRDALATGGKLRGWLFTQGNDQLPPEFANRHRQTFPIWVVEVYAFMEKEEGTNERNSDRDFNNEVNAIVKALNGPANTLPDVLKIAYPFGMKRGARVIGQFDGHVAAGNLYVQSC